MFGPGMPCFCWLSFWSESWMPSIFDWEAELSASALSSKFNNLHWWPLSVNIIQSVSQSIMQASNPSGSQSTKQELSSMRCDSCMRHLHVPASVCVLYMFQWESNWVRQYRRRWTVCNNLKGVRLYHMPLWDLMHDEHNPTTLYGLPNKMTHCCNPTDSCTSLRPLHRKHQQLQRFAKELVTNRTRKLDCRPSLQFAKFWMQLARL